MDKIILIDLDKTLVDLNPHLVDGMCYTLDYLKIKYDRKKLDRTNNLYGELRNMGVNTMDPDFWKLFNGFDDRKEGIENKKITLFPYTIELLESFRDKKVAIVSDTPWFKAEVEIKHFGIDKYIRVFSHWDESKVGRSKPHPMLALEAIAKLGFNTADKIYFVGDDEVDIRCGYNLEKELKKRVIKIHVDRYNHCTIGTDFTVPNLRYVKEIIEGD